MAELSTVIEQAFEDRASLSPSSASAEVRHGRLLSVLRQLHFLFAARRSLTRKHSSPWQATMGSAECARRLKKS